jgi:hypothetical protein
MKIVEPIAVIYNSKHNTLFIFDVIKFTYFITQIDENYFKDLTILSIYNNSIYGHEIDMLLSKYILIYSKEFVNKYKNILDDKADIIKKENNHEIQEIILSKQEKIIVNTSEYHSFINKFNSMWINYTIDIQNMRETIDISSKQKYLNYKNKYLKYKTKYLVLKNQFQK